MSPARRVLFWRLWFAITTALITAHNLAPLF